MTEEKQFTGRGRTPEQTARLARARAMRARGKTWQFIADSLGITRQAASQMVKRADGVIPRKKGKRHEQRT